MFLISYKNNGSSRAVTEKMKVRAGSVELSWLSLATKFLNGQKFTCATYSHGTMQILLQIAASVCCSKTFTVLVFNSAFVFFRFWPREIRRVKPGKILNVKLLVISIFIFKWCREIPFESYYGSMIQWQVTTFVTKLVSKIY